MRNDDLEGKKSPLCPAVYQINLSNAEIVYARVCCGVREEVGSVDLMTAQLAFLSRRYYGLLLRGLFFFG